MKMKPLRLLAALCCLGSVPAFAADGAWKFGTESQGHPDLSYSEPNKTVFTVACGHAFVMRVVYPGAPIKEAGPADDAPKATIAIANGKTTMTFAGTLERGLGDPVPPDGTRYPPEVTYFFQSNLGYERSDPDLYEKKWRAKEVRLFDFLDSGRPLTISAEGKSYVLPPIKVQGWKSRFKKIC